MFNIILFHTLIAKQLKITERTLFIYASMPIAYLRTRNYINMCYDIHTQYHPIHICRITYY